MTTGVKGIGRRRTQLLDDLRNRRRYWELVGLGGLGVTCSPRDPRFAGSNPTEVDGFFRTYKMLSQVLREEIEAGGPESEISGSLKNLNREKIGL